MITHHTSKPNHTLSTQVLAVQAKKYSQAGKMLLFCAFVTPWFCDFDSEAVWGSDLVSWPPLLSPWCSSLRWGRTVPSRIADPVSEAAHAAVSKWCSALRAGWDARGGWWCPRCWGNGASCTVGWLARHPLLGTGPSLGFPTPLHPGRGPSSLTSPFLSLLSPPVPFCLFGPTCSPWGLSSHGLCLRLCSPYTCLSV